MTSALPTIVSLFSGAGGLDKGFELAGFNIIWANEYDATIKDTYNYNFPHTVLDTRSIKDIPSNSIPDSDGIIGGPPCQSWSVAGSNKGAKDSRGQLFFEYIRIIKDKQPRFFVAENVEGLTRKTHQKSYDYILNCFVKIGYKVQCEILNACDYDVPQDRKRVFFVGIRDDINFNFSKPVSNPRITLNDSIRDLLNQAPQPVKRTDMYTKDNGYLDDSWSSKFMSRNRVRSWDEVSFTIPATGRHITIHPQAPKMTRISTDNWIFTAGYESLYRRFTIREVARIQTFPDTFEFLFNRIENGYKMIGNAVPPKLAYHVATGLRDLTHKKKIIKISKKL